MVERKAAALLRFYIKIKIKKVKKPTAAETISRGEELIYKRKKGKGKLIIIIVVALLLLGGGVFAGVYYGMSKANSEEAPIVEAYTELGQLLVNLSDEGSKKYVQMTATVTYDSANTEVGEEITTKLVALRDSAIFYLKSLKTSDFTADNEVNLKRDLVQRLNSNLKSGTIIDIKFNELLVQ